MSYDWSESQEVLKRDIQNRFGKWFVWSPPWSSIPEDGGSSDDDDQTRSKKKGWKGEEESVAWKRREAGGGEGDINLPTSGWLLRSLLEPPQPELCWVDGDAASRLRGSRIELYLHLHVVSHLPTYQHTVRRRKKLLPPSPRRFLVGGWVKIQGRNITMFCWRKRWHAPSFITYTGMY